LGFLISFGRTYRICDALVNERRMLEQRLYINQNELEYLSKSFESLTAMYKRYYGTGEQN
jgi:hypothetical protein